MSAAPPNIWLYFGKVALELREMSIPSTTMFAFRIFTIGSPGDNWSWSQRVDDVPCYFLAHIISSRCVPEVDFSLFHCYLIPFAYYAHILSLFHSLLIVLSIFDSITPSP